MNHIGQILEGVRMSRGLTRSGVGRRLGYGKQRKGIQRLAVIEATGIVKSDLLVNLLEVLQLDLATFEDMCERLYLTGHLPTIPPVAVEA